MPRSNATYGLDDRVIEAVRFLAKSNGVSINSYMEGLLWRHAVRMGVMPASEKRLGESRGRKRKVNLEVEE